MWFEWRFLTSATDPRNVGFMKFCLFSWCFSWTWVWKFSQFFSNDLSMWCSLQPPRCHSPPCDSSSHQSGCCQRPSGKHYSTKLWRIMGCSKSLFPWLQTLFRSYSAPTKEPNSCWASERRWNWVSLFNKNSYTQRNALKDLANCRGSMLFHCSETLMWFQLVLGLCHYEATADLELVQPHLDRVQMLVEAWPMDVSLKCCDFGLLCKKSDHSVWP